MNLNNILILPLKIKIVKNLFLILKKIILIKILKEKIY